MNRRLYFLDNLRGVAIFMVVVLHVFLCYMKFAPDWWFVIDPQQSVFFTLGVILIDVPIMPVMFFIAGYFVLPSLQRSGVAGFWRAKFRRIIIPWVLGVLFIAPPAMFMILLSRGKAPDYSTFWFKTFWTSMYSQSVFWFLGLLTLCYLLLTILYNISNSLQSVNRSKKRPGVMLAVLFVLINSVIFFGVNRFYPADTWITDYYLIVFQPVRLALYLFYFALGILAWKRRWFELGGYTPRIIPWLCMALFSAVFYLSFKQLMATRGTEWAIQAGNAFGFNVFAYSTMMACFALFSRYINSAAPVWRSFSASSYGIYIFHSIAVYYGAYFLLNFDVSPFIKAPVLLIASTIFCWIFTVILKRNKVVALIL